MSTLDDFTRGYITALLWSSTDTRPGEEEPRPLDDDKGLADLAPETLERIVSDCSRFQVENAYTLASYCDMRAFNPAEGTVEEYAGHDFALSRNGHGTGFWDRDCAAFGVQLHAAAQDFGEFSPYVGDDGQVYA